MSSDDTRLPQESLDQLDRARRGDSAALAQLLTQYRSRLLERIRLMMGPEARGRADSTDFLQGVMLETARQLPELELRDERTLFRWMTAVARNQIRATVRTRRCRAFESLSASWSADEVHDDQLDSPHTQAHHNELRLRLVEALEALADDHREVVELRDFDDLSYHEIGRRLGRSEDAARMLHTRAMRDLVRMMR